MLGPGSSLNDRYVLGARIGGGGMGEVWRADDTVLGRTVAVKVLMPALSEDPTFAQRFQNEARAMATLTHPGVVDVYDYGICDVAGRRVSFLVMEHIQGESLDRVLRRGPLGVAATMRLIAEVADALAAAHAQGIVHRDVKPANLMVKPGGSVVLTDFGIAHSASAGQLTATGTMLCSAGYCAPEMATSNEVTPAVDVYALGVVAYECLLGHLPFQGDTPIQIIFKHLNSPVPRLPDDVPAGVRQVVERALEKAPEARWRTAPQMAEAARAALTGSAFDGIGSSATFGSPSSAGAQGPSGPSGPHGDSAPGSAPGAGTLGLAGLAGAPPGGETSFGGMSSGSKTPAGGVSGAGRTPAGGGKPGVVTAPGGTASSRRRRTLQVVVTMAAAVLVSAAVAGFVWFRPTPQAVREEAPSIPISVSSPADVVPTTPSASSGRKHTAEPTKRGPTPRATRATPVPSPSPTVTTSSPATESPTATPTTSEPEEPTQEPTTPGPEEPTSEPTITAPPGEIQCIRAPCP
ncbi:serine/threonine-protein kinase [Nonomuraea rubra]|uniref:non-specific serine/threonine protein kinase n=2 Tax=Nonomuraea rubra TaxID=46180 RepID=A0A7X0NQ31_9ACTN|nr:serine/threonine-protein kinase [Nonomuraea rubra]MBB6547542.1 serine/threonine-protein kinase [Nonomuraea rubra]